jgi:hypothetical protein
MPQALARTNRRLPSIYPRTPVLIGEQVGPSETARACENDRRAPPLSPATKGFIVPMRAVSSVGSALLVHNQLSQAMLTREIAKSVVITVASSSQVSFTNATITQSMRGAGGAGTIQISYQREGWNSTGGHAAPVRSGALRRNVHT